MKLLSFKIEEEEYIGIIHDNRILDLNSAFNQHLGEAFTGCIHRFDLDMLSFLELGELGISEALKALEFCKELEGDYYFGSRLFYSLDSVHVISPIPRPRKNIVCLGLNYADHVREGKQTLNEEQNLPKHPIYFTKPPTTVTGPYDDIIYPRITEKLDYEVELALIIGKSGKNIPEKQVYDHIYGYAVFNDVSARDLQTRHGQWFKGKSCDTFSPIGPYLVTADEIVDPMNLNIWLNVNGKERQSSNTSNMIFNIPRLVSDLSQGVTLEVGDIIATGTPSGVGSAHTLGLLKVGDIVEAGIDGIGSINNKVIAEL